MGLCGYGLPQALTIARICFTDRIFFSCHSPPSGVLLAPPFLLPSPRSSFPFPYSSLLTFSHRILHRMQSVPYLHRGTTATGMLSTCALLLDALAVLPSPLSRAIRFADDSSPLTISDGGVSLQRTRKSKSVGGVKGKAAIQTQTKKTTKAVRV